MERHTLENLLTLMARLRKPDTGCPWDLDQSYLSITPSTIEEAYEVVDAIEREDYHDLKEELGDLLFQVVFYGQLAKEEGRFDFHDVVDAVTAKLLRRHPHVFPDGTLSSERNPAQEMTEESVKASWEAIKASERGAKGLHGVFDDIPGGLPAMTRAVKLQKRAAKDGFDWPSIDGVVEKLDEEVAEFKHALQSDQVRSSEVEEELGDILFSCVNLARHLKKDPEALLRQANHKFSTRYQKVADNIAKHSEGKEGGKEPPSLDDLERYWQEAKGVQN